MIGGYEIGFVACAASRCYVSHAKGISAFAFMQYSLSIVIYGQSSENSNHGSM